MEENLKLCTGYDNIQPQRGTQIDRLNRYIVDVVLLHRCFIVCTAAAKPDVRLIPIDNIYLGAPWPA